MSVPIINPTFQQKVLQKNQAGEDQWTTIDTTSPGGKITFHIFCALAEFERGLIRERVNAGLAALKKGKKGGRP
jgi:DNA invertase Pin-like site-specific DNA recombinase